MAWIESHDTLAEHPKTLRFARLIKAELPTVIGHLHLFWWWCLKYADDGNLSEYEPAELATAAKWGGDAELFVCSLVRAGFIEQTDDGGLYVHDWYEYAGKLIEMRKANAERMRQKRATHKPDVSNVSAAHVQRTYDARTGATVPNPTVPYPLYPPDAETTPQAAADAGDIAATPVDEQQPAPVDNVTPAFETAWAAYPSRRGKKLNKGRAQTAFRAIKPRDWDDLLLAIANLARSDQGRRGVVEDMHRFLGHWRDWLEPEDELFGATASTNGHGGGYVGQTIPSVAETKAYADEIRAIRAAKQAARAGPGPPVG